MLRSLHAITVGLLPCFLSLAVLVALTGCGTMSGASRPVSADVAGLFIGDAVLPREASTGPEPTDRPSPASRSDAQTAASDAPESLAWLGPTSPDVVSTPAAADSDATVVAAGEDDVQGPSNASEAVPALLVTQDTKKDKDEYDVEDYDPWERLNEKFFDFNVKLDRHVLKPVAKVWDKIVPDRIQVMIANMIDNAAFIPRLANSLFQGKWDGALREVGRFMLNTTIGVAGMFDVAKHEGIEKSREDFGQTLGFYGADPGPYIIVPFLEPLTLRDGLGRLVDTLMDPVGYFVGLFPARVAVKGTDIVNDRALNLELFQGFEETTIDLYSAVRHAYLQRRLQLIKE